jgi:hypothetical protein
MRHLTFVNNRKRGTGDTPQYPYSGWISTKNSAMLGESLPASVLAASAFWPPTVSFFGFGFNSSPTETNSLKRKYFHDQHLCR